MARAKVIHSTDAVTIVFNGDKSSPEPTSRIIKFPNGHVEVTLCSDGSYWAHLVPDSSGSIQTSRLDYADGSTIDVPDHKQCRGISLRIESGEQS